MKILIGADHRGFKLKEELIPWFKEQGYNVEDCGNDHFDPVDDYVDFAKCIVKKMLETNEDKTLKLQDGVGILICGSGIGVSIVANRYKGIRAGLGINKEHVRHMRENDHVNILALASNLIDINQAKEMIITFLTTKPIQQEKYIRRIKKADEV